MAFGHVDYCFALGEVGKGIAVTFQEVDENGDVAGENVAGFTFNLRIRLPDGCIYNAPGVIVNATEGEVDFPIDVTELKEGLNLGQIEVTDLSANVTKYTCEEDQLRILYGVGV